MKNREGFAWAAGFFDGEGHVGSSVGTFKTSGTRKGGTTRRDLYLVISQTDRRVLDRFRAFVGGLGRVSGPLVRSYRNPNEHDVYQYQVARFEHVQAIVAMMWPWLSPIKKAQAVTALTAMRARSTHQRQCTHGHARTPENTYMSGGKRHCKLCRRDQSRRNRLAPQFHETERRRSRHLRLVKKTAAALLVAS